MLHQNQVEIMWPVLMYGSITYISHIITTFYLSFFGMVVICKQDKQWFVYINDDSYHSDGNRKVEAHLNSLPDIH
jgi:hypothetical protein